MGKNSINVYFWHWKFYILLEKLFCISSLFYAGVMGKSEFLFVGLFISVVLSQRGIFEFPIKQIKRYCFLKFVSTENMEIKANKKKGIKVIGIKK